MRATVDREEFFGFQHGDGRLKLIERLAAAYSAGELPDYMLEFVDSLKTRATRVTPDPPHVSSELLVLSPRPDPRSPDLPVAMKRHREDGKMEKLWTRASDMAGAPSVIEVPLHQRVTS
jgi:hypothetical protein